MTRILVYFLAFASTAIAGQCPQPNEIYRFNNGIIEPIAPSGWMFGSLHMLESADVRFMWAAWAEHRIDQRDERRVLCVYGNPDIGRHGVILETVNIVDKSLIANHPEWKAYGEDYYRCQRVSPVECPFG